MLIKAANISKYNYINSVIIKHGLLFTEEEAIIWPEKNGEF